MARAKTKVTQSKKEKLGFWIYKDNKEMIAVVCITSKGCKSIPMDLEDTTTYTFPKKYLLSDFTFLGPLSWDESGSLIFPEIKNGQS